jgi:hypothetical protein
MSMAGHDRHIDEMDDEDYEGYLGWLDANDIAHGHSPRIFVVRTGKGYATRFGMNAGYSFTHNVQLAYTWDDRDAAEKVAESLEGPAHIEVLP